MGSLAMTSNKAYIRLLRDVAALDDDQIHKFAWKLGSGRCMRYF